MVDVVGAINSRASINTAVSAGERLKQNAEFDIQIEQNAVNRSPAQNITAETRVDPAAPITSTPLANPESTGIISDTIRGTRLDISA
ncbi:MAG: hypothetical protein AAF549_08830 [Pseudomonadota bacterium]